MRTVYEVVCFLFGLVFVYASLDKILFPADFAVVVSNYQLVPATLLHPAAIILPWLEAVCGLALMAGAFTRGAALILNLLLVAFMVALWIAKSRGLDISCGCFTVRPGAGEDIMEALIRDAGLLAAGLFVLVGAFWTTARDKRSDMLFAMAMKGTLRPQPAPEPEPTYPEYAMPEPSYPQAQPPVAEEPAETAPPVGADIPGFGTPAHPIAQQAEDSGPEAAAEQTETTWELEKDTADEGPEDAVQAEPVAPEAEPVPDPGPREEEKP